MLHHKSSCDITNQTDGAQGAHAYSKARALQPYAGRHMPCRYIGKFIIMPQTLRPRFVESSNFTKATRTDVGNYRFATAGVVNTNIQSLITTIYTCDGPRSETKDFPSASSPLDNNTQKQFHCTNLESRSKEA